MEARDRLLSALCEVQESSLQNYLSPEGLKELSRRFALSMAELRGVASYYSMLSLRPRGRHIIRLCVSPVCRMLGSVDLLGLIEGELGLRAGETSSDGLFTLEETQCLGRCAGAPAMMVDAQVYENLDIEGVRRILASYRKVKGGTGA